MNLIPSPLPNFRLLISKSTSKILQNKLSHSSTRRNYYHTSKVRVEYKSHSVGFKSELQEWFGDWVMRISLRPRGFDLVCELSEDASDQLGSSTLQLFRGCWHKCRWIAFQVWEGEGEGRKEREKRETVNGIPIVSVSLISEWKS